VEREAGDWISAAMAAHHPRVNVEGAVCAATWCTSQHALHVLDAVIRVHFPESVEDGDVWKVVRLMAAMLHHHDTRVLMEALQLASRLAADNVDAIIGDFLQASECDMTTPPPQLSPESLNCASRRLDV